MIRIPGKIPITIHPWFWLVAGFIGFFKAQNIIGTLVWIGVIFVSVLVHELGHAWTASLLGRPSRIDLVAFGGITSYSVEQLSYKKQFLIVFNGPLFGFLLFLLSFALYKITPHISFLEVILPMFMFVNLFWTILNLLPVLPLDGGQLLRITLEGIWGVKGLKASLLIGMVVALGLALWAFLLPNFILGALFFLFAFQSFETFRKVRFFSSQDQDMHLKEKLSLVEKVLKEGKKEEAQHLLEALRLEAKEGMIFYAATQYLSFIYFEQGKRKEAYELLLSIKEQVSNEALYLLHLLAEENKNYSLVAELSSSCYEIAPTQEVAIRNAKAYARLQDPTPAGGWLQTAWKIGRFDIATLLQDEAFLEVKKQEKFQQLIKPFTN